MPYGLLICLLFCFPLSTCMDNRRDILCFFPILLLSFEFFHTVLLECKCIYLLVYCHCHCHTVIYRAKKNISNIFMFSYFNFHRACFFLSEVERARFFSVPFYNRPRLISVNCFIVISSLSLFVN